jgi:hypothetical protein
MAQAQINTQIATVELQGDLMITSEMGFTRLVLTANSNSKTNQSFITGNIGIGKLTPKPIVLYPNVPYTIGNGNQLINNLKLSGSMSIIAFQ